MTAHISFALICQITRAKTVSPRWKFEICNRTKRNEAADGSPEMADKRPETGQGIDALINMLKAQLPRYQEASVKQYRDFVLKNIGLFDVPERGKCNRMAAQLRQVGNRLYLQEKYNDALEKFNESICFAENDSDQLGMGYANR